MAYTKYSLTPANNNATPPDGAPEGMLPSAVNDTMRDMMAQIRDVGDGIRNGTYTMTAPVITGGSITGVALSGNTFTNPVITGGSINNTPIGASTANTGAFTTLSASGAFSANGGATLGDASGDALTINSSAVSIPNGLNFDSNTFVIDAANNNVGIGTSSPSAKLDVSGAVSTVEDVSSILTLGRFGAGYTWSLIRPSVNSSGFEFRSNAGTAWLNINTSGNVGIGTSSPNSKLDVRGAIEGGNGTIRTAITFATTGIVGTLSNHALSLYTNTTERMRIDSSGNVGIGTSSPATPMHIQKASGNTYYRSQNNLANVDFGVDGAGTGILWNNSNYPLAFGTNNTERMRITSDGILCIGTTSTSSQGRIKTDKSGGGNFFSFGSNDSNAFTVYNASDTGVYLVNGQTSWTANSDERLKDIIEPISNASEKIASLRAVIGKYKTDEEGTRRSFLIAQDVQKVLPEAVNTNAQGKLGLQYTDTIPLLVAAIQEQQAMIEELKQEVAALKAK